MHDRIEEEEEKKEKQGFQVSREFGERESGKFRIRVSQTRSISIYFGSRRRTLEETFSRCVFFERNRDKSYYLWANVITLERIKALGPNLMGPFPGSRRIVCHGRFNRTEPRRSR